jgi:hypothetical protein
MGPLQRLGRLGTHAGIVFMRLLAPLPLPWVRRLGVCLGYVLYAVVLPRRRVVQTNLALCFPALSAAERRALARQADVPEDSPNLALLNQTRGSMASRLATSARGQGGRPTACSPSCGSPR